VLTVLTQHNANEGAHSLHLPEVDVIPMPCFRIVPNLFPQQILQSLTDHRSLWWVSSRSALLSFHFHAQGARAVCVGDRTAFELERKGFSVVASQSSGEALFSILPKIEGWEELISLRGSLQAFPLIEAWNNQKLFFNKYIREYQTYEHQLLHLDSQKIERCQKEKDLCVVFASPASVNHWIDSTKILPFRSISIGPRTTEVLRGYEVPEIYECSYPSEKEIQRLLLDIVSETNL